MGGLAPGVIEKEVEVEVEEDVFEEWADEDTKEGDVKGAKKDDEDPVSHWDPAGLTPCGSVENSAWGRRAEVQHGHLNMLAAMRYVAPEYPRQAAWVPVAPAFST